jgi:hypothetical protein
MVNFSNNWYKTDMSHPEFWENEPRKRLNFE